MTGSFAIPIAAAVLVFLLLLTATVHLSLRNFSPARVEELLERKGREELMDRLIARRANLAVSVASLRTACTLLLAFVILRLFQTSAIESQLEQYVLAFVTLMVITLVFGVAAPVSWSKYRGENVLVAVLPLLLASRALFGPLVAVIGLIDDLVRRLADVPFASGEDRTALHEQRLLDVVSEGERTGAVDEEEKEMIESIMDLRDSRVAEIMTPRTEIQAVTKSAGLDDIKTVIEQAGHSRIPVFEDTIDRIVGIIYAKDLLQVNPQKQFDALAFMRPPLFVPESKNLRDLLHEFQSQKVHMAIVLDEYGGTAGLVTLEDLLEELVGDIADEYDSDKPEPLVRIDDDTVDVDARVRIDEINEELDLELPEDDRYETLGGFVFSRLGHVPAVGEGCTHENIHIKVTDAEPRRINRLQLRVDRTATNRGNGR